MNRRPGLRGEDRGECKRWDDHDASRANTADDRSVRGEAKQQPHPASRVCVTCVRDCVLATYDVRTVDKKIRLSALSRFDFPVLALGRSPSVLPSAASPRPGAPASAPHRRVASARRVGRCGARSRRGAERPETVPATAERARPERSMRDRKAASAECGARTCRASPAARPMSCPTQRAAPHTRHC